MSRDGLGRRKDVLVLAGKIISPLLILLLMGIFISGCSLFSSEPVPNTPPGEPGEPLVLFADDFSDDAIGALPSKWTLSDDNNLIDVEVVTAEDMPSGKAIKITGGPSIVDNKHARLLGPLFGPEADGVNTIVIEHDIQYNLRGSNVGTLNMYITKSSGHRVHWNVGPDGNFQMVTNDRGSTRSVSLGQLQDGWNRIRLVANRQQDEIYIYLNDMETPVLDSPLRFRQTIDTWTGAQVIFLHHFRDNHSMEVVYGDIKVWALD